ncbi:MAG: sugar phosphate isomerase/epimerase [Ginsengibacter sp.]
MIYPRRKFIKTAATGIALTAITGKLTGCNSPIGASSTNESLKDFGLQLYTLRDDIPKDPKNILKQVASMGYKQIESFEGDRGMFWGMTNVEFKKYLDDIGLTMISSHCDIDKDFEQKANEAAAIGMKYLLSAWVGPQKTLDDYKKIADKFNDRGEICKKAGLKFAYHNHDYSFTEQEGQFPQDIFMQNSNKDIVDFEMDIYWVVTAGQDPVAWLKKYPNRFKLAHIKDRKKNVPLTNKDVSCIVGQGEIDFAKILNVGKNNGFEYYIVEQELYENTTPLLAAKADADYLKQLKF